MHDLEEDSLVPGQPLVKNPFPFAILHSFTSFVLLVIGAGAFLTKSVWKSPIQGRALNGPFQAERGRTRQADPSSARYPARAGTAGGIRFDSLSCFPAFLIRLISPVQ